ncbi:hypothetical protein RRG08_046252 [Elysia crispata]|uniref:Hemoglobinase n=1 Tax=Elysia crispata TaxID=231223 RepID=A0AAE0YM55_9GAST|nr:hypothetical protein RRG08_046252 [Elysia crispata]
MSKSTNLHLVAIFVLYVAAAVHANEDDGGRHWALLVAGSNTYLNYRHQADICHAYHIVSRNGIPDERIIVMMYDDIAYNPANPFPGNIINQPNGTNVYPGVPKDYTKKEVRPDVFLKVLTGDAEGIKKILGRKGKVIESGPKDRIFVNFADHGGPGVLAFPDKMLFRDELHTAILHMHKNKQYSKMLFYVEACESGSMFSNFTALSHVNVFATTAANPDEPSEGCYFDNKRQTALGDVYSVNWMQDSDKENLRQETLSQQYKLVKSETKTSHVMEYGDLSMGKLPVADFLGSMKSNTLYFAPAGKGSDPMLDSMPSQDVGQEILLRKISRSRGEEQEKHKADLETLWQRKKDSEAFFKRVFAEVQDVSLFDHYVKMPLQFTADFHCYKESVKLIMDQCPGLNLPQNDYALRKLRVLANMCETKLPPQKIWRAIVNTSSQALICA